MALNEESIRQAKERIINSRLNREHKNDSIVVEYEHELVEPKYSIDISGIIIGVILVSGVGYLLFLIVSHFDQIISFILKSLIALTIGAVVINCLKNSGSCNNNSNNAIAKRNYQEECDRKDKENWEKLRERTIQSCRNLGSNTQVFTVDGHGRSSGGFCIPGTLHGYTSNTVTVRRGKILVTYNAYGSSSGPTRWAE